MKKNLNELIGIYICTYNEENNIEECIEKIKNNFVYDICIVDASLDDKTSKLAMKSGARVLKAEKGLAGQRQIAIKDCKKDFLMFVDADDRLEKNCIKKLYNDLIVNNYDAVQSSLRVFEPKTYWQKGMDNVLRYCISIEGKTNMVGRPALYKTKILKDVGMDLSFNNIGNEDSALSIRLEKIGAIQGISSGISYRKHPEYFKDNYKAWKKYGYGDAKIIEKYPEKKSNILKHLLYVYPIKRSFKLISKGKIIYILFTILTGIIRFYHMNKALKAK